MILLLDEATSELDTLNEAEVYRNLGSLRCTRIVIAHRLSTIARADLILVMDHGRVVERGTHAELEEARGLYHAMLTVQESEPGTENGRGPNALPGQRQSSPSRRRGARRGDGSRADPVP